MVKVCERYNTNEALQFAPGGLSFVLGSPYAKLCPATSVRAGSARHICRFICS